MIKHLLTELTKAVCEFFLWIVKCLDLSHDMVKRPHYICPSAKYLSVQHHPMVNKCIILDIKIIEKKSANAHIK